VVLLVLSFGRRKAPPPPPPPLLLPSLTRLATTNGEATPNTNRARYPYMPAHAMPAWPGLGSAAL
jgi:hypothetical protein